MTDKNYFMTLTTKLGFKPEGYLLGMNLDIETRKLEDDFAVIIYHFPKPVKKNQRHYGAILIDNYWGRATYYTLEMCNHKGRWALGRNESEGHSLMGLFDIEPTKQNFLKLIVPPIQTIPAVDIKALLGLPSNYHELNKEPDDPDGCVIYGTTTPLCKVIIKCYMINQRKAMPFDNEKVIIEGIHMSLPEDEALIEVKAGNTNNKRRYVYSTIKIKQKPFGVQYYLQMDVEYQGAAICINGYFVEKGTTGMRDNMIWVLACREGIVSASDNSKWMFDPYNKSLKRPYMMESF